MDATREYLESVRAARRQIAACKDRRKTEVGYMRYTDKLKAAAEHEHKRALAAEKEVMSLKIALDELTVLFAGWITQETIDRGRETDTGEYTLDYPIPHLQNLDDWQTEQSLTEDSRVKVTVRKRKEPGEAGREWRRESSNCE